MEKNNLYNMFCEVEDFRRKQGQMHDLPKILIIVTMSIMSGYNGIRAIGDFINKHKNELIKELKLKKKKLPSFQTISRVLNNIDFEKFSQAFNKWAIKYVEIDENEWLSLDGKAIRDFAENNSPIRQYGYIPLWQVFRSIIKRCKLF